MRWEIYAIHQSSAYFFWNDADKVRYFLANKYHSYAEWEGETVRMVARLIKNRENAKKELQTGNSGMTEKDCAECKAASNTSFGLAKSGDKKWQKDWDAVFDVLTGSMLLGHKVPLWAERRAEGKNKSGEMGEGKGQQLLSLWHHSYSALNCAIAAASQTDDNIRSQKHFEHLFRSTATYSIKRFKSIGKLHVYSMSEMDFIGDNELKTIVESFPGIKKKFKMPGNAMHLYPGNYGLSVHKSVNVMMRLPPNYQEARELTTNNPRSLPFQDKIIEMIDRDIGKLHLCARGTESKLATEWKNARKRLIIFIPEAELTEKVEDNWWDALFGFHTNRVPTMMSEEQYVAQFKEKLLSHKDLSYLAHWDLRFFIFDKIYQNKFPTGSVVNTLIDGSFLAQRLHTGSIMCGSLFTMDSKTVFPVNDTFEEMWRSSDGKSYNVK